MRNGTWNPLTLNVVFRGSVIYLFKEKRSWIISFIKFCTVCRTHLGCFSQSSSTAGFYLVHLYLFWIICIASFCIHWIFLSILSIPRLNWKRTICQKFFSPYAFPADCSASTSKFIPFYKHPFSSASRANNRVFFITCPQCRNLSSSTTPFPGSTEKQVHFPQYSLSGDKVLYLFRWICLSKL